MNFKASCLSALFNWHWLSSFPPIKLNLFCLAQTSLFTDFSFTTEASFMLPIHSRHYNRVQESRLQAKLFLAFSIDRYRRIFLDLSHICDTRSVANLSIYWSVGNHFLCRQKLWWVYLKPKLHGEQAIWSTMFFFRDLCLIVQHFRTVLFYLSYYSHLKWLLFFLEFGAYVFSKHLLAPLHALASGPSWASDESFGGS